MTSEGILARVIGQSLPRAADIGTSINQHTHTHTHTHGTFVSLKSGQNGNEWTKVKIYTREYEFKLRFYTPQHTNRHTHTHKKKINK